MKTNPEKSCLLLSSKTLKAYFDGDLIESCSIEKLFKIGPVLAFDEYIFSMCKKVGMKKKCS